MAPSGEAGETVFNLVYFDAWQDPVALEILNGEPRVEVRRLALDDPPEAIAAALAGAHGFQVSSSKSEVAVPADGALLARAPLLLAVSTRGAGFDTVDLAACSAAGVAVVTQTGLNREAVAEHVVGMMLALAKRMIPADRAMRRERGWKRSAFKGDDVRGRTLGIIGLGNIGTRLAQMCRAAFAMEVVAYDPYLDEAEAARRGARQVSLESLLRGADFVSVNCPYNAETAGLLGAVQYRMMRPGAYLVTTARGGIHDEAALAQALREGWIAGAGLDVWAEEPPPLDHPLLAFDNVLLTPHIAGVTRQAYRATAEGTARQWLDIVRGSRPPRLQDPAVWPRYRTRFAAALGRPAAD